jgi:hypothetical protein
LIFATVQIQAAHRKELAERNTLWLFSLCVFELMETQLLNAYNDRSAKKAEVCQWQAQNLFFL